MKNLIHFVRRSAAALIAGLVVCSAHAATLPSSCNPATAASDGVTLLRTCSPEITFYVVATEDFNVNVTNSWLTTNMVKIFDVSKPIVTVNLAGNTTANAFLRLWDCRQLLCRSAGCGDHQWHKWLHQWLEAVAHGS